MTAISADICIIGAGAGGLSVAAGAAQLGLSVVLIEAAEMGGDCLNTGCVPSKAVIAAAARAAAMRDGGLGIAGVEPQVDFAAVMDHAAGAIAAIAPHDSQERFEGLGVRVIRERAQFAGPAQVTAGPHTVDARRFVIATGSRPVVPPIPGLNGLPYLTNETLFSLRERPGHLLILGAGPIGLEMAQSFRRLGSAVTVIEAAGALGREDPEAAALVLARLRAEGVTIIEGVTVARLSGAAGAIVAGTEAGENLCGTHLLVAVGRRPATDGLSLDRAGVAVDPRGWIRVNDGLRTTNGRVFAIGDVAGQGQFTHLAGYHAGIVIRSAVFGLPARARPVHVPRALYTDPGLAQIGMTEAEARAAHGAGLSVHRIPVAANDRAVTRGERDGFIKLMVHRGRPVGVTIVAPDAGEIIAPFALGMAAGLKLSSYVSAVYPYPTMAELSKRAASDYLSPKLFDNRWIRRLARLLQRLLP